MTGTTRRTFLKATGAVPLAMWLASCAPGSTSSALKPFTLLTTADTSTIDPTFGFSTVDWNYMLQVFEPLVYRDSSNRLQGRLAEEWSWEDPLTFNMRLREGVTFHSGAEFDATAVQASFDRLFAVTTQNRAVQDIPYDGVDIKDTHNVSLKLKSPSPLLAHRLRLVLMLDPTVYAGNNEPVLDPTKVSGTGAYRVIDYTRGQKFELEANEDYWEGAPSIKQAVMRAVSEDSTRMSELLAGSAQVIQAVPLDQADQLKSNDDSTLLEAPQGRNNMLALSCDKAPFNDIRARQAVNYAIDKEAINRDLLSGYAAIYGGMAMPPNDNPAVDPYPYDPERAKTLLEEAGAVGQTITIQTTTGRYVKEKEICQAIASYLEKVGLKTNVEVMDFALLQDAKQNKKIKEATFLALGGNFDGEGELRWALDAISMNGWKDETYEAKFTELTTTQDDAERTAIVNELQEYLHEQAPWLFLWRQPALYGTRDGVTFEARPDENFLLSQASERA